MSHVRLTVNGEQEMDEYLGPNAQPPDYLKKIINPNPTSRPDPKNLNPHELAVGLIVAMAPLKGEDADIQVTTEDQDAEGWTTVRWRKSFAIALPAG